MVQRVASRRTRLDWPAAAAQRGSLLTSIDNAVRQAVSVLRHRPAALASDIDGTLSRIVSDPEDAVVSERARAALRRLLRRLDLVAVITARQDAVARRLIGLDEVTYMGSYALDAAANARLRESEGGALRRWAATIIGGVPGARLEEKDVSFAFHYRGSPDPWAARLALLDRVVPFADSAAGRIVEGKRVIEVVPALLPDKDAAFARLVNEHRLRGAVFMGDDGADGAVFRAIAARQHVGLEALAVAVIDPETPPSLIESAGVTLDGVDAVEAFLDALATAIETGANPGVAS